MGGSALHPVLGLVQLLRQETSAEQPGARAMADLLTQALLLHVLRAYAQSEAARQLPGVLNLLAEPRLQAVVQAMWQQPGGDWSLDSLAERAAMSRATFSSSMPSPFQSASAFSVAFRKYSGQTPARYRREHG